MRARVKAKRIATWLLLAAAVSGAVAYTVARATLPSDGARIAFYGDSWSDTGIRIEPIDAPAPGLRWTPGSGTSPRVRSRTPVPRTRSTTPSSGPARRWLPP